MTICDGIETGVDYFWKCSGSWNWERERRWWAYWVEFKGMNGAGGCWIIEKSQWNGYPVGSHFSTPKNLSWLRSRDLIHDIKLNLVGLPMVRAERSE